MTSSEARTLRLSRQPRVLFGSSPVARASILFLSISLAAGAADIQGWSNARWGMTEQQILDAFPTAVRLTGAAAERYTKFGHAPISIPDVEVAGIVLTVHLVTDPKTGLRMVLLSPANPGATTAQDFQTIEALLVQKYGQPWNRTVEDTAESQWSLASTIIKLESIGVRLPGARRISAFFLSLTYEPRQESPL
jgi:hypothetical protein